MRIAFALFLLAIAASAVSAQWNLTQLNTSIGNVYVRNENITAPTPATNYVAPSSGSLASLQSIKNFIIIINNQESYDSVLGAFPKGNGIASSTATPAFTPQVVRGQYAGTPYAVTPTAAYSALSPDPAGQLGTNTLPNLPFLFSNYSVFPNTTLSHDPEHGFFQTIYKIDGGKMDGFMWSGTAKSGALPMGYWNLTGSALWSLASNFTLFDKFFSSLYGGPFTRTPQLDRRQTDGLGQRTYAAAAGFDGQCNSRLYQLQCNRWFTVHYLSRRHSHLSGQLFD